MSIFEATEAAVLGREIGCKQVLATDHTLKEQDQRLGSKLQSESHSAIIVRDEAKQINHLSHQG